MCCLRRDDRELWGFKRLRPTVQPGRERDAHPVSQDMAVHRPPEGLPGWRANHRLVQHVRGLGRGRRRLTVRRGLRACAVATLPGGPPVLGRDHHADTGHGHEIPPVGQPCLSTAGRLARNPETLHEHRPARRRTTWRPLAVPDLTLNDGSDLPISRNAAQVVKAICAHMPNIATA